MNCAAVACLAISTLGLAACGSSPSPLNPSPLPAALLLTPADAADGAHALHGSRPTTVAAIVIDRGELDLSTSGGLLSLSGTRGFSFSGRVSRSGGVMDAFDACVASNCAPVQQIPLTAAWSGTDLPGSVTLDSQRYIQVGSLATSTSLAVEFSGSVLAPALTDRHAQTATAPFTLRGAFVHADASGLLVTETLSGVGVARVSLTNRAGDTGWSVEHVVYKLKHQP